MRYIIIIMIIITHGQKKYRGKIYKCKTNKRS